MKASRHSGQVISNDDGFNPAKILDDLHAKSVREFEDQNICPSSREGIGVGKMISQKHFVWRMPKGTAHMPTLAWWQLSGWRWKEKDA